MSGAKSLVTWPSEKALVDMLEFLGFSSVYRYYSYSFFSAGKKWGIKKSNWGFYMAFKKDSGLTDSPSIMNNSKAYSFLKRKDVLKKLL